MTSPAPAVAVIAGVGPGLGWALASRFARAGLRVVAAARHPEGLEGRARQGGEAIALQPCDVTQPADVAALFARADGEGELEVAVFNAGAYERGSILDMTPEAFERCWRVGCLGGFLFGQAAARRMVPRGSGTLLFTGATASLRGSAGFANLAVPKFGLRALAQSMARELGPRGVHVAHVIIDGQIASERNAALARERGEASLLPPDEIAEAYFQLHRQGRGAWTHELDLRPWVEKF